MTCPCGSRLSYEACCGRYISGSEQPPTAEALMRARYTAFARKNVDYLAKTFAPQSGAEEHARAAKAWIDGATFKKLQVLSVTKGGAEDRVGRVEFLATYEQGGENWDHHEVSEFARSDAGQWFFIAADGHRHRAGEGHHHDHHHHHHEGHGHTLKREGPKVGRNDPCPCGSGKKYKKCHGATA